MGGSDFEIALTESQVAEFFDNGTTPEELDDALAGAQDRVNTGKTKSATILITIKKE